jgi:TonB family protein
MGRGAIETKALVTPAKRSAERDSGPALPRAFSLVQHYPDGPTSGAVVVVRITTDVSGRVTQAAVVSNSGDTAYSDAALSAVRNQRIQPARRDCENVAGSGEVTVTFAPR